MTSPPEPPPSNPLSTNTPPHPNPSQLQPWDYLYSQIAGATRKSAAPRIYGPTSWKQKNPPPPTAPQPFLRFARHGETPPQRLIFGVARQGDRRKSAAAEEEGEEPTKPQGGSRGLEGGGGELALSQAGSDASLYIRTWSGWWGGVLGEGEAGRSVSCVWDAKAERRNPSWAGGREGAEPSCFYEPSGPWSCCCSLTLLLLLLLLLLPACLPLTAPTAAATTSTFPFELPGCCTGA